MRTSIFACAALAGLLAHLPQAGAATPPPAPKAPAVTDTQTFQDWSVHCVAQALPPCEMLQVSQDKAGKLVTRFAIAYLPRQDRYALQLTVPLGVSLAKGVRITASDYAAQALPYVRCDNSGCYVEGAIEQGALDKLGHSAAQARLTIASVDGREINLPLSLRGFSDARSAMDRLAREKMAAAPPPAAKRP